MKRIIEKPAWLPLSAHLSILSPQLTAKQRVVIIPDQPEEGIDGYGKKDLEKRSFKTRVKWKTPQERHKKGQQEVQDQSVHDDGEELGLNEGFNEGFN